MQKETKRQQQIGELLRRNFGEVLQMQGSLIFGGAFVTVTKVKMTSDLGIAKVYLSVYQTEGVNKEEVLKKVRKNSWSLKKDLAHRIRNHVRRIPTLDIYLDDTLDEMYHLNDVFNDLRKNNQLGKDEEE